MVAEPAVKRAVTFFDGQNLYRHAKDAFGHHHPNYDPKKLSDAVSEAVGVETTSLKDDPHAGIRPVPS